MGQVKQTTVNQLVERFRKCFKAIDEMVERVDRFKVDPCFSKEVDERRNQTPDLGLNDDEILRLLVALIAYSNNAKSEKVTPLVERQIFKPIFKDYRTEEAARLSAEDIRRTHWQEIKSIRFKYKVDSMVRCASCLITIGEQHDSFMRFLNTVGIPTAIGAESEISAFWDGFGRVQARLLEMQFPYVSRLTSLCHLLMDLGFDCAKPDIKVMEAATELGIVSAPPAKRNYKERDLKEVITAIQLYAISRNKRASVVDLYFLIHGGQSDSIRLVHPEYYSSRLSTPHHLAGTDGPRCASTGDRIITPRSL